MIKTIKILRATLKTIKSIEELSERMNEKDECTYLALFLAIKRLEFQYSSLPTIMQMMLFPYVRAKLNKVSSLLGK